MAKLVVLSEKLLRRVMRDYLPSTAVVITTGTALREAGVTEEEARAYAEGDDYVWDECEVMVDIADSPQHVFFKSVKGEGDVGCRSGQALR